MAQFLRGKQAGIQGDLSHGISPDLLQPDDVARHGINSLLSAMAYDPVQSLLAVGTSASPFGPGLIYVFGQKQVKVVLDLPRDKASVKELQFCANRLICRDNSNEITVFNLESRAKVASYMPPGTITAMVSDPSLDYCLTGLQSGDIVAYDLDRETMTQFKIPPLWQYAEPQPRGQRRPFNAVVSLQFHPKDIGTLLIGYHEGAVIYSFKQNKILKSFQYDLPSGAPGGSGVPPVAGQVGRPKLTHAIWHPTGTFILTAHDDSSLVFWDPRDGRMVHARSIQDVDINVPKARPQSMSGNISTGPTPYSRIAWCSQKNPDETGLLVAGGSEQSNPQQGLVWIELGLTPNYQTSSWDLLANHFRSPKRIHILPTPPDISVTNFILVPRASPHFAGSHDPIVILITLASGAMRTLSFPNGYPLSPTNQLHTSLTFVHPFITKFAVTSVERVKWLGLRESRQHGPNFLLGGAEATKTLKRFEDRNILQAAHGDGTVRVWDIGHGDEIENSVVLQADLGAAVGRFDNILVTQLSMSGATTELSVGLASGEVVVFRYNTNQNAGRPSPEPQQNEGPGRMTDITRRVESELKEGLLPLTLTNDQQGPVTALKHSDVGFVAAGYESGGITIIDLRGPAIIHTALLHDLIGKQKKSAFKRNSTQSQQQREWAVALEFGVMTLDDDKYSSIALFVGTNCGRVVTFRILPSQSGRYSAQFAGVTQLSDDRVISIAPIHANSGSPAYATGRVVSGLQSGQQVDGVLVVTTVSSAHIFKPASSKGASKSFDNVFCDSAAVCQYQNRGYALIGLFGDNTARAFSIPALKEIGSTPVDHLVDTKRFADAKIVGGGEVIGWKGPSELSLVSLWGTDQPLPSSQDLLYDPAKPVMPRPTISNLQWIAGTQYITPADMDILIGGPDRPPSKRMIAEMRAQQDQVAEQRRQAARAGRAPSPDNQEGYWEYMQRQIQQRTEQLGLTSESMDRTADSTSTFSNDVSKYVAKQKRAAAMGFISSKLGF